MNQQVIEYYEQLLKIEVMQKEFAGTTKTLKELVEQYIEQDAAHKYDIYVAYANVVRDLIGE